MESDVVVSEPRRTSLPWCLLDKVTATKKNRKSTLLPVCCCFTNPVWAGGGSCKKYFARRCSFPVPEAQPAPLSSNPSHFQSAMFILPACPISRNRWHRRGTCGTGAAPHAPLTPTWKSRTCRRHSEMGLHFAPSSTDTDLT